MRQIYYYRLGSAAARIGCYAVKAGLKLRATVALPPIFTAIAEQPATIPEPAPAEEPVAKSSAEETPQPHDGAIYVPGFGYLKSKGPGEWSVSENMYENGNKVGSMG